MTKDEALKLALDALEFIPESGSMLGAKAEEKRLQAITAIKEALAQPEEQRSCDKQEPVAWTERELELIDGMIEVQLHHALQCDHIANRTMADKQKGWDMERVTLLQKIKATTPPQEQRSCDRRTWVGLTDEERLEAAEIDGADEWFWKVCKAIEAKLKEKNT